MIHMSRSRFTGLIAILTCVSGMLVTGLSETATDAEAEGADKPVASEHGAPAGGTNPAEGAVASAPVPPRPAARPKSGCLTDETALSDAVRMRDELAAERQELEKKEAELAAREKALTEELAKIEAVRDEIQAVSGASTAKNEEKIAKLVETFESMSPKSAAQVISNIDEILARDALARLSSAKVGKILAAMDVSKSARLTESLAGVARAKKPTASKPLSEEAPSPAKGAAEATTSANTAGGVKGGEKNGNLKQSDSNVASRQPEPALGREPAGHERR